MKLVPLAIQMVLLAAALYAEDPLMKYVEPSSLEQLRAGRTLEASIPPDGTLSLAPRVSGSGEIAAAVKERKPSLGVEVLRVMTGLPQEMDSPPGWLLLFNCLHAVSTMKGIPYFSVTRNSTHVLFTDSYAVDPGTKKQRIDDPVFTAVPLTDHFFTFQQDEWFGKNTYEEVFSFQDDRLVVTIDNLTTISFLFLPIIQPRNLVSMVTFIPSGSDLMFYGVSFLSTSFPLGDKHSREQSLSNRLIAMADWLSARLTASR